MMVKVINKTGEVVTCCTRLNQRWFAGIQPGETVEVAEEKKVAAFLNHGCEIVKEKPKPVVKKVKRVKR